MITMNNDNNKDLDEFFIDLHSKSDAIWEVEDILWEIAKARRKIIHKANKSHTTKSDDQGHPTVVLKIHIRGNFRLSDRVKTAVLAFMDDFCPSVKMILTDFSTTSNNSVDPGIQEVITKASGTCKALCLVGQFSCLALQVVQDFIQANGGIQYLECQRLLLSDDEAWDLKLMGTGQENSVVDILLEKDSYHPDDRLAQFLRNLSGFREIQIRNISFLYKPKTFQTLGEILSWPECEISKLELYADRGRKETSNSPAKKDDCLNLMLESVTINNSIKELSLPANAANSSSSVNKTQLVHLGENLYKFQQMKKLELRIHDDYSSLEFLRPLWCLDNDNSNNALSRSSSSSLKESLEMIDIQFGPGRVRISNSDDRLLSMLGQYYPKLSSFGKGIVVSPAVHHILRMNGKWRQFMTKTNPPLALSLWGLVLEKVEKQYKTSYTTYGGQDIIPSIQCEIIKHLVPTHFASFTAGSG